MKALSIQQPFAWLIANGYQDIENRDWYTRYRGLVLIHASKTYDFSSFQDDGKSLFLPYWERRAPEVVEAMPKLVKEYEIGGIIGYATLKDVVTKSDSPWFRGKYGFVLTQRHTVPFIPLRGQLGLFDVSPEIEAQINAIRDERAWEADLRDMGQIKREWRNYRLEGDETPPSQMK